MDAQRWAVIESLYRAALAKEPGERSAYLAAACADDLTLRSEVESLLGYGDTQLMSAAELAKMAELVVIPLWPSDVDLIPGERFPLSLQRRGRVFFYSHPLRIPVAAGAALPLP